MRDGDKLEFVEENKAEFSVNGTKRTSFKLSVDDNNLFVDFGTEVPQEASIKGSFEVKITSSAIDNSDNTEDSSTYKLKKIESEKVGIGNDSNKTFELSSYPVVSSEFKVKIDGKEQENLSGDDISLTNNDSAKKSQIIFTTAPESGKEVTIDYYPQSVSEGEIKLCTNFTEFKKFFGDFLLPTGNTKGQNTLAHAVYGFFRNGGTRCYITWITREEKVSKVLDKFEAIDEITIVAAPGNLSLRDDIKDHCEKMGDRIAVLDSDETIDLNSTGVVDTLKPEWH